MALPLANSFEGGTASTTITAPNSGGASGDIFDGVTNTTGTIIFDATNPAHGAGLDAKIGTASPVTPTYMTWTTSLGTLGTGARIGGRFYYVVPGNPTSSVRAVQILDASNVVLCGLNHASGTGDLNIRATGDATSGTQSGTALTAATLWRVEFDFQGIGGGAAAGSATGRLFAGDATTATGGDASTSGANFGSTAPTQVRIGVTTANATVSVSYYFDGLQLNSTGLPGPELVNTRPLRVSRIPFF